MADTPTADDDLERFVNQFQDAYETTQRERSDSEMCRDYYDGKQLTDAEEETLRKRKQPIVISNRIAPKIDALLGHEKRLRTEPKAYPRTPHEEQAANSATDAIRFVCDENNWDAIRSVGAENLFIEGIGAVTVTVTMEHGQPDVKLTAVPWDRFYRDPHSRMRDFKDASFLGVVIWMDEDDALATFKGKEDVVAACYTEGTIGTFADRPKIDWGDSKRRRVRVLQHRYRKQGEWWTCIFCRGGYLRDPQVSPYKDEYGTPVCDLLATSAYVDRENRRYGLVKRHISPQDEINKRRSKALHLLNSKKIIAETGAVANLEQARREAARPDGYIEVTPNLRFEFVEEQALVAGQFQLLQESKAEIDASGINPSLSGDQEAPSGRAQEMLVSGGLMEMATVFESLRLWSWEVYRHIWYRIRQYWTEDRWIRVTDDERNLRWVQINKPVTRGEDMQQQMQAQQHGQQPGQPPQGQPGQPQQTPQQQIGWDGAPAIDPNDPRMQEVVRIENKVAELDVDIILEDAPESVTLQSEQFQALIEMKKADPTSISTKAILQASSLRNKDQLIADAEQGGVPPQVQQHIQQLQQQLQQAQQQLQQAQSDQGKEAAQAQNDQVKNSIEMRKLEIQQYEAETARIVALKPDPLTSVPNGWIADGQTPGPTAHAQPQAVMPQMPATPQ